MDKKYRWIGWIGLFAILFVAIELIYTDLKLFCKNVFKKINLKNMHCYWSGQGIGRACYSLAEAGATVIGLSRTQSVSNN